MKLKLVKIGTEVKPYGKVGAILYIGERYYLMIDRQKVISLMPAHLIEAQYISWIKIKKVGIN